MPQKSANVRSPKELKVQFGSGPKAYAGWLNFDCSPTLIVQKLPVIGSIARKRMNTVFEKDVKYGDTRTGLPLDEESVSFLYCSHVLEHLSLEDFRRTLRDCYRVLTPGGVFRMVMPDLETLVSDYLATTEPQACSQMMQESYLGTASRPRGLIGLMRTVWGNSQHLWLWDYKGAKAELEAAGFIGVRRAHFGDSAHAAFNEIEDITRWEKQLGLECRKPERLAVGTDQ
jgi:predicted SAM-dependent methyltransferase